MWGTARAATFLGLPVMAADRLQDRISDGAGKHGGVYVVTSYGTRAIKRRARRSKAEIEDICEAIHDVLHEDHPQSVRHVFYRLTGTDLIPKDDTGYRTVQRKLLDLREADVVPWDWVSDGTRWRRVRPSFNSAAEAVRWCAETYRRDLWRRTPAYVEVWCESDSIAGVLIEETDRYNVPLMVSRGFSSRSYLHRAAKDIETEGRPAHLYYIGDWDPSGKMIPEKIIEQITRHAPEAEIHFERLLVNPDQIAEMGLPTKPAKRSTHSKGFVGGTVEAEAVPAHVARRILREAIEQHLDMHEVRIMRTAEESERGILRYTAERLSDEYTL